MKQKKNVDIPTLVLSRDGYQVERVLVGPYAKYVGWVLLRQIPLGSVEQVASGWAKRFEDARADAYRAFEEHSRMEQARQAVMRHIETGVTTP